MTRTKAKYKILIVTNMYPCREEPYQGIFVKEQIEFLKELAPELEIDLLVIRGQKSSFNYLKGIFQVRRLVEEKNYNLIHAHYGLSGLVSVFQRKVPVVCTFHGSDVLYIKWQSFISRIIAPFFAQSIAINRELSKKLPTCKISVIPCGVNMSLFKPMDKNEARRKMKLDIRRKYLLFPSDPSRKVKNYPLFEKVLILIKEKFNADEIILSGLSREEVKIALNAADVVVITSHSEAGPLVLKEALACNTPVVSVNVGEAYDILKNTKGCYITSREPNDICKAVEKVLNEGEKIYEFREKIRNHSWEVVISSIINLYYRIL